MKKLAGLIIILAVLVLGGYYGMGVLTERTIKKDVQIINQTNGLYADIEQYQRGWFTSHAQIKWRLHVPERIVTDASGNSQTVPAQDYQVQMPLTVFHGPIIYSGSKVRFGMGYAEAVFPFPDEYKQQFDAQFTKDSIKPQLNLNVFVNYLCKSSVEIAVPTFKVIAKDGGVFDWKGMLSSTALSSHMDKVDGDIVLDGFTFTKDDASVNLEKVTIDYDLNHTATGIYLGDASLNLPSLEATAKSQKIFALKDLDINTSSDVDDGLFSTHLTMELGSSFANGKKLWPR